MSVDVLAGDQEFEQVIQRLRVSTGIGGTDKAVADLLGLSGAAYSNRKRGGSLPYSEIIDVARRRHLDLNRVFGVHRAAEDAAPYDTGALAARVRLIQLVGRSSKDFAVRTVEDEGGRPCIEVPETYLDPDGRYRAHEIRTDAMSAACLMQGDIVLAQAMPQVAQGAICLISVLGGGFWVRRYWRSADGGCVLRPESHNDLHRETAYNAEEAQGIVPIGVVTHVIKRVEA